jgi:hypothetical protein
MVFWRPPSRASQRLHVPGKTNRCEGFSEGERGAFADFEQSRIRHATEPVSRRQIVQVFQTRVDEVTFSAPTTFGHDRTSLKPLVLSLHYSLSHRHQKGTVLKNCPKV